MPAKNVRWAGRYHSGVLTGAASADGATAGRFWIVNNVGSDVLLAVTKITLDTLVPAGTSIAQTRITAERMTFTGDPSGATGVPAPRDTDDPLSSFVSVRTASTGMVITAGEVIGAGAVAQAIGTPTNIYVIPVQQLLLEDAAGYEFRAGQGLVLRQADAGDTDQKYSIDIDFFVYNY